MNFDIQKFASDYVRDNYERTYTGRRRLAGNYGRLYVYSEEPGTNQVVDDTTLVFEIKSFTASINTEREDVYIGISKDSKVVGLTGEGELTIDQVFDRGYSYMVDQWQKGHDIRYTFIGTISDPDAVNNGEERVKFENVWLNELEVMKFEKGAIVEKTISFGFTPSDVTYESTVQLNS